MLRLRSASTPTARAAVNIEFERTKGALEEQARARSTAEKADEAAARAAGRRWRPPSTSGGGGFDGLLEAKLLRRLGIVITLQALQQFSGINAIVYYTPQVRGSWAHLGSHWEEARRYMMTDSGQSSRLP